MKKFILVAIMAIMGLQSQAQIVSSRSAMIQQEEKRGWNTLAFEYLPTTFSPNLTGWSANMHGFAFTWMNAISLTPKVPIYLEPGVGLEFLHSTNKLTSSVDMNYNMFSVKIPLNFIYNFQIPNTRINIAPYAGLRFRINAIGEFSFDGYSKGKDKYNAFDKDDMGKDNTFNRFNMGWQIGAKFRFAKFFLGVAYGTDFNELSDKNTLGEGQFSIGVAF